MAVTITPVGTDPKALDRFQALPYAIYADDPNQVFPLIGDQKHFFDRKKNPFWRHAEGELWLAEDEGRVVGRIGACIDQYNNEHHKEKVGFFGFYEVEDHPEAARALLETAAAWIAERGMETAIARFHNVYGPNGTWDGGREKAPAAMCRKVIEAKDTGAFSRPPSQVPFGP